MRTVFETFKVLSLAVLIGFVFSNVGHAQNDPARFIMKLNDSLIKDFKGFGSLRSQLPNSAVGQVNMIEIRYTGTETQPAVDLNADIRVDGQNAELTVTDAMLDTIRRQPVRIPLNGKSFSVIFLRYNQAATATAPAAGGDSDVILGEGPNRFVLRITDESTIAGSVVDMTDITMVTNFGEVKLTLDQIAGVRFQADGKDNAVVFLNNGDSVTGTPTLGVVNIETFWGLAEINAANVRSMSISPSAQYVQENTDFGVRWKLKLGNARAPGAPGSR